MQSHHVRRRHAHCGHLGFEEEETRRLRHVFFVRTDNQNGWDEMVSRHCLADDVQRTPYKKSMFVRLGSVNPRAADALHDDDGWMAFDMVTVEQQFRLETPPPRLNLTKACNAFLKSVAPHMSVGHAAMDYEINNRQMLLEAQKFPGGHNGQDDGCGTMTTMLGRWAP